MAVVSLMDLWDQFQKWKNRRDNPHEVTAAQVGAYSKTTVDTLMTNYIPNGFLPFSRFGQPNGEFLNGTTVVTGDKVSISIYGNGMPVVLGGTVYELKDSDWEFTAVKGKNIYVYVNRDPSLGFASCQLVQTDTTRPDTPWDFVVGVIRWPESQVEPTADFYCVLMLETYRLSATPIGSAIPVSTGRPTEVGDFQWGK